MSRVGYVFGALLLLAFALPAAAQQPFADVPLDHWAYDAVGQLAEAGLMVGYPDGQFKGKHSLTRYEFATAISRAMDRLEQIGGVPGEPGPPGPAGPAGPPGAGITPEQQAILDRLAKEFAPELKSLRADLDGLTKRVEDLEAEPEPEYPIISVSGNLNWRVGLYGTDLDMEDAQATGYPFVSGDLQMGTEGAVAPYGGINIPEYVAGVGWGDDPVAFPNGLLLAGSIPISDSLKDAFKAGDFMTLETRINIDAELNDNAKVRVAVLAGPENNDLGQPFSAQAFGSPLSQTGNGVMDQVSVDEAWVDWRVPFLLHGDWRFGKQYMERAQGLLMNNDQESINASKTVWQFGDFGIGVIWGMLDLEQFYGRTSGGAGLPTLTPSGLPAPSTDGQDDIFAYALDWDIGANWDLDLTFLQSGLGEERGWSVGLEADEVWGIDWYGEYAELDKWQTGKDWNDTNGDGIKDANEVELSESDTAWFVGARYDSPSFIAGLEYGEIDAGYAISIPGTGWSAINPVLGSAIGMYTTGLFNLPLSLLHPDAEVNPHDINWIDRPLFLDATNIAKGWKVDVTFPTLLGEKTPVKIAYMDGDSYDPRYISWLISGGPTGGIPEPDEWRDADRVWYVQVGHHFTPDICANLLYGQRDVDNVMSRQEVPIVNVNGVDYFAEKDDIQVLRAEVNVAF
jgi:hypothetical protein